jgi:hypothetical protein
MVTATITMAIIGNAYLRLTNRHHCSGFRWTRASRWCSRALKSAGTATGGSAASHE